MMLGTDVGLSEGSLVVPVLVRHSVFITVIGLLWEVLCAVLQVLDYVRMRPSPGRYDHIGFGRPGEGSRWHRRRWELQVVSGSEYVMYSMV